MTNTSLPKVVKRGRALTALLACSAVLWFEACSDNVGALDPTNSGGTSGGGSGATGGGAGTGGAMGDGGTAGSGGASGAAGGDASGSGGDAGSAGSAGSAGNAGSGAAGSGGMAGGGGSGGSGGAPPCIYDKDVPESDAGSDAGSGVDGGGIAPGIALRTSGFGGQHLTDSDGRPLYTFGTDIPGDCNNDPQARCSDTCLQSWPSFDDPATSLDPAIDPAAIGSTYDALGKRVVTYYGWPLYYYANDTQNPSNKRWSISGAGTAKVWHLAKLRPPNIVIMRVDITSQVFYLADGAGMTLYAYADDTTGAQPVSACVGSCLSSFQPLITSSLSAVSSLDTSDLSLFVRADSGKLQAAYKGAPLYVAAADQKPGNRLAEEAGVWSLVTP